MLVEVFTWVLTSRPQVYNNVLRAQNFEDSPKMTWNYLGVISPAGQTLMDNACNCTIWARTMMMNAVVGLKAQG